MKDREIRSDKDTGCDEGSNPSKATSQLLSDYLKAVQNSVFEPLKRGVFEPGFNPIDYERFVTILCTENGVGFETYPDVQILSPVMESKRESIPVFVPQNGELYQYGVSS